MPADRPSWAMGDLPYAYVCLAALALVWVLDWRLTSSRPGRAVKALRDVGFAAWLRTPEQGFVYHIHANAVGDTDMSGSAQAQVHDYYFGKNGLANHAADNTPAEYRGTFTWWEKYNRG
jgi:hypothetical protein